MMYAEAHFTPVIVRVLANHAQMLWLRFGTVRYGFPRSQFFNSLRGRFVPVRFLRRRYGTVHPSIGGCTRTTPVPPDLYRPARTTVQTMAKEHGHGRLSGGTDRAKPEPVRRGRR